MNRKKKDFTKHAFRLAHAAVKAQYDAGKPVSNEMVDAYAIAYMRGFKDAQAELRKEVKACMNGANEHLTAERACEFIKPFR